MSKNVLIVLKGLPASGKSTYRDNLLDLNPTFQCVCPDLIRKELYGNESIQGDGKKVFDIAFHDMREFGCIGANVIFDATNLNRERRKKLVKTMRPYFDILIIKEFTTPFDLCVARNEKRERQVPLSVMRRMSLQNECVISSEGWDYIEQIKNY